MADELGALEAVHEGHVAVHQDQAVAAGNYGGVVAPESGGCWRVFVGVFGDNVEGLLPVEGLIDGGFGDVKLVEEDGLEGLYVEYLVVDHEHSLGLVRVRSLDLFRREDHAGAEGLFHEFGETGRE